MEIQEFCPLGIIKNIFRVLPSVKFDGEFLFRTVEIEDVATDGVLPSEFHTELNPSEFGPEDDFLWSS